MMRTIWQTILFLGLTLSLNYDVLAQTTKPTTILALGDSITQGGSNFESYTIPLWQMLTQEGYAIRFLGEKSNSINNVVIRNCGYSGQKVEYLESRIEELYRKYPADVVLLHAGHNHFIEENPVAGMVAAHRSIIEKIIAINPDARILVAEVVTSGKLPKYSYIPELNFSLKQLIKEIGSKNVILVNQAKGWRWQKHTIHDKVHPNKEGSRRMAKRWMKSLCKLLPRR